jgi:type IV secretion system protein TrbJ
MMRKKWIAVPVLLGLGYVAVNPQPLYALFGLGDVVFDPTTYATIGEIWNQDISNGAKLIQTYNQTVKIAANGLQIYTLATQMARRIENKDVWRMAAFAVGNEEAQRHYNESVNFSAVMNGDALNAGRAWQQSTLYAGNAGYLGSASATNSRRMAEFATIQMLDATSQRCAQILANYKQTQEANQDAEDKLAGDTFDQSDGKNSMVSVLNVLSGGSLHLRSQEKANGNLQACLAEQKTLEAKAQRDKLADEQSWYSDIAKARASSPAMLDPERTGTHNYLEP